MNMTEVSQDEIVIVLKMFNQYHRIDKDTAHFIAQKMLDLSHDYPDNLTKLSALNMYGYSLMYSEKYDEATLYYEQTKTLAILLENDRLHGTALFYLGKIKQRQDEPNEQLNIT
jgi:tetratricopeptide (TPR) repeat protein